MLLRRSIRFAAHSPCITLLGVVSPTPTPVVRCFATRARKGSREKTESGFQRLGVSPDAIRLLKSRYNIVTPTEVQEQSLPLTLNRKSCIIQSPTGSGKTLSFLIPTLEDASPGLSTVILAPTRELATQLHQWAMVLAGTRKMSKKVMLCVSGIPGELEVVDPLEEEEEETKNGEPGSSSSGKGNEDAVPLQAKSPNVVIGTPKKVLEMLNNGTFAVRNLRRVVLDECDKLIAPMNPQRATWRTRERREKHPRPASLVLTYIRKQLQRRQLQLICTSATADMGVKEELRHLGWSTEFPVIQCSTSRTTPSVIQHHYMIVKNKENAVLDKIDLLVNHFLHANDGQPGLVFIHRGAKIDRFVWNLRRKGLRVVALYEKMNDSEEYEEFLTRFQAGEIQLAVGTEETVRGLDFPWVQTVYIMEVPRTAQEYLHLCGRVGRVGRAGQAVVLLLSSELPRLHRHYAKLNVKGTEFEVNPGEPPEQNGCHRPEEQPLKHTT